MTTPFTTGTLIEFADYNQLQSTVYDILGNGNDGYGLVKIDSVPVSNLNIARYDQWGNLVSDLRRIDKHINNLTRPTINFNTGTLIRASSLTEFYNVLESLEPERYTVAPAQIYVEDTTTQAINFLGVETTTPYRGGVSVTDNPYWVDKQEQITYVTWGTHLLARHFFNAGGELIWTCSLDPNTGVSDSDQLWTSLVDEIQNIDVATGFPGGQPFKYDRDDFLTGPTVKLIEFVKDTLQIIIKAEKIPAATPNRIRITVGLFNYGGIDLTPSGYNISIIPGFELLASSTVVTEGNPVTFTVNTTNIPNGTLVPWSVSGTGITTGDFLEGVLSGNFTINNNSATVILTPIIDFVVGTEGNETFTFSLDGRTPPKSINVQVIDLEATFSLSPSSSSINEGQTVTITINTTNVPNDTNLNYILSGIAASELGVGSLSGTVTITGNTGSISFTPPINFVPQGSEVTESFTFTINPSTIKETSTTITINGVLRTYSLSTSPNPVDEGSVATTTLSSNLSDGQSVGYTITGTNVTAGDLGLPSLTGNFVISGGSGQATLVYTISADLTSEGNETVYIRLTDNTSTVNTFDINDTSISPDTGPDAGGDAGSPPDTGSPDTTGVDNDNSDEANDLGVDNDNSDEANSPGPDTGSPDTGSPDTGAGPDAGPADGDATA